MDRYVRRRKVLETLEIHYQTLNNMVKRGDIEIKKTGTSKMLYNLDKYLRENGLEGGEKVNVCYCRVSSNKQKGDLRRQVELMKRKFPNYLIIKDIGSGLNFDRPGLKELITMVVEKKVNEVVVTYKDRLARIGYELIEWLIKDKSNGKVRVLNKKKEEETPEEELAMDVLTIMNVYVAKINGRRSAKNRKERNKD
jgi:putative resolvase